MICSLLLVLFPQPPPPVAWPQAATASGRGDAQVVAGPPAERDRIPSLPNCSGSEASAGCRGAAALGPWAIGKALIAGLRRARPPQAPVLPAGSQVVEAPGAEGATLEEVPGAPRKSALLVHGGRIRLGDPNNGVVEALAIEDGRVVAAGTEAVLAARMADREVTRIDLDGATAVPGLQDAHGHLEEYGAALEMVNLRGLESLEAVIAVVSEAAREVPEDTWILGRGWDQNLWAEVEFPDHHLLSLAVPEHPVYLLRVDGHAALVNQRALEIAELDGVLDDQMRLKDGRVLVDDELLATGVLLDAAMKLVGDHLPAVDLATRERWILQAQKELLALGLTCIHDMGTSPSMLQLYEDLLRRGLLKIRIVVYLNGNGGLIKEEFGDLAGSRDALDRLAVAGVKLIADGGLGSWGAAMLADYTDRPGERGYLLLTEEHLTALVHEAWQVGLQPAVHAEGDLANRMVLDVYERMLQVDEGFATLRPRIEHAQVISTRDFPRFPALGILPSMQPSQAIADLPWVVARLGKRRVQGAFAWRRLAPGILDQAFGSDFPAQNPDPLIGIHAARIRKDLVDLTSESFLAEEGDSGAAALGGFTYGAARAAHQEDRRGCLLPGYFADLTVLDVDPTDCRPEALLEAKVLLTVINGEVVYRR